MRAFLLSAALMAVPVSAQTPPTLTLERVFASPALSGPTPRAVKLSPDGRLLTLLKARDTDRERFDLWAIDTTSGAQRMLVDSTKIGGGTLSEAEKMQRERLRIGGSKGIVSYDWGKDGRSLLVPADGDLYLASIDGEVRRLTETAAGELNPTISPKGGYVAFVRDQNMVVLDLGSGTERALTTEGKGTVHFGEAEFVAQEEMDRRTGYWWSPDETRLAVQRFDEAPVGVVTRAAIGADGTRTFEQRYPAAGTNNVDVALFVIALDGSRVQVDLGPERDIYLARVDWAPDGRWLYVQRQSRDQKTLDLLRVDPATGRSSVLFSERSPTWVELNDGYRFLRDGSVLWTSERDGFTHLYRWRQGRWTQLTKGRWNARELLTVDEAGQRVVFIGNKDDVLEQHIYSVGLNGGEVRRLTERGYWHCGTGSSGAGLCASTGGRMIVSRSSPSQPTQVYLADFSGKRLAWVEENRLAGGHPYAPFAAGHALPRFGTIAAKDGTELHWSMLAPALEPGKRYPVFFQHYGGPGVQVVQRGWTSPLHQYLVDRGWIVFQLDNRGSANRGVAFGRSLYHAMGAVEVEDQVAGANYLKTLPFVDGTRIATYGWSYGGYMTLKMLQQAPGVFAAGIAGAPVTKWELYDTHYTERFLGDPRVVPDVYRRANAMDGTGRVSDPLLLIHGMADDNVVLDNSTAFAAKMQAEARPFEMMFYPGQTHGPSGAGVNTHIWRTIENFLDRHVLDKSPGK